MNCSACTKINPLPACLTGYGTMELANITLPNNTGEDIVLKITDTATRQVSYVEFIEGDVIDITDLYPLMQHYYKLEFTSGGVPAEFHITNPDATVVEGCCIEFIPSEGLEWAGSEYDVSTTTCTNQAGNVSNTMISITGLLTQSGVADPTAFIFSNTIGDGRVTFDRISDGSYEVLLDGGGNWTVEKTWYYIGTDADAERDSMVIYFGAATGVTNLYIDTYDLENDLFSDGLLSNVPFEIRLYP
jgi:hypothetical protein